MQIWNIIIISTLLVLTIATLWFVIVAIKTTKKFTIQQLQNFNKVNHDIEKLKMTFQDEIIKISKVGDALKLSIPAIKELQKIQTNFNNIVLNLNKSIENLKHINNDNKNIIAKVSTDIKTQTLKTSEEVKRLIKPKNF